MRLNRLTLAIALVACDSGLPADHCGRDAGPILQVQEPFQYRCHELNPEVELDRSSPDYGRAFCSLIEARSSLDTEFCTCREQGYSRLSDSEKRFAIEKAAQNDMCKSPCCEGVCFCEIAQHSGEDLSACQSGVSLDDNGWCFVAPSKGLGTLEAIEQQDHRAVQCPNPQAILYTGNVEAYFDGTRFISCWR